MQSMVEDDLRAEIKELRAEIEKLKKMLNHTASCEIMKSVDASYTFGSPE